MSIWHFPNSTYASSVSSLLNKLGFQTQVQETNFPQHIIMCNINQSITCRECVPRDLPWVRTVTDCTECQMINIKSEMFFTSSESSSILGDHDGAVRRKIMKFPARRKLILRLFYAKRFASNMNVHKSGRFWSRLQIRTELDQNCLWIDQLQSLRSKLRKSDYNLDDIVSQACKPLMSLRSNCFAWNAFLVLQATIILFEVNSAVKHLYRNLPS